ncbi:triphosphoribosyl-dephospho-CoA synthase, partial [Methylobacterium brachythecii]
MSAATALRIQSATCEAAFIARCAVEALRLELDTYPKPGLVSLVDSGSHDDMDAATFKASAAALEPYFCELAEAGARGLGMDGLRRIGLAAEAAMLAATGGVNTHRGAIFGLGLLAS